MKTSKFILLTLLFVLNGCVGSSVNNAFDPQNASVASSPHLPTIVVADLEGKEYTLPKDFPGACNVVVFGFSHEQKDAVSEWMKPLEVNLQARPDCSLFKMPVIDRSNAALRTMIRNGMRTGITDSVARKRTLTLFVDQELFIKALGTNDATQVMAGLFNNEGAIVWQERGAFDTEKLNRLKQHLP